MINEMGNQNASGIRGEENDDAVDAAQNIQESAPDGDDVKGENHIMPESESKDYLQKAVNPSKTCPDPEVPEPDERDSPAEKDEEEPESFTESPEGHLKGEEESICEDGYDAPKAAQGDGDTPANCLEALVGGKTDKDVTEIKGSTEIDYNSEVHESTDVITQEPGGAKNLSPLEDGETQEMSACENTEENGHLTDAIANLQGHGVNAVPEDKDRDGEKNSAISSHEENAESLNSIANEELPPEIKSGDYSESTLEDGERTGSLDLFTNNPSPNEKSMVLSEQIESINGESENGEIKHDMAEHSYPITEASQTNISEEEEIISVNSTTAIPKNIHQDGDNEVNKNADQTKGADKSIESLPSKQPDDNEEIMDIMAAGEEVAAKIRASAANNEIENENVKKIMRTEQSATGSNKSDGEGNTKKSISRSQSHKDGEYIKETSPSSSDPNPGEAIKPFSVTGEHNIQSPSGTPDSSSEQPNDPETKSEITPLASSESKVPESNGRFSVGSNPEPPSNGSIELRKCPSFDFGIALDARSEEIDQTPLLRCDKAAFRSFSSSSNSSNLKFQSANGRRSLDVEPVVVQERSIRVERSDSCYSRPPFHNPTNENTKNSAVSTQELESHDANGKVGNDSAVEVPDELNSPRSAGKRRPRSSLFTTCLCCTAAIS